MSGLNNEQKELVLTSIDPDWQDRNTAMHDLDIAWDFYQPTEKQIQEALQ